MLYMHRRRGGVVQCTEYTNFLRILSHPRCPSHHNHPRPFPGLYTDPSRFRKHIMCQLTEAMCAVPLLYFYTHLAMSRHSFLETCILLFFIINPQPLLIPTPYAIASLSFHLSHSNYLLCLT